MDDTQAWYVSFTDNGGLHNPYIQPSTANQWHLPTDSFPTAPSPSGGLLDPATHSLVMSKIPTAVSLEGLTQSGEFWMLLAAQSMAVGTVMVRYVAGVHDPIWNVRRSWTHVAQTGAMPTYIAVLLYHQSVHPASKMDHYQCISTVFVKWCHSRSHNGQCFLS